MKTITLKKKTKKKQKNIVSKFQFIPNAANCQTMVLIHPLDMECLFDSALEESVFPVDDAAGVLINTVVIVRVCSATADSSV